MYFIFNISYIKRFVIIRVMRIAQRCVAAAAFPIIKSARYRTIIVTQTLARLRPT